MSVFFRRRGEPPATTVDVVLSGSFNKVYGYVTIDGTKYTSAQTITLEKGASVTVYCSAMDDGNMKLCKITLNGTTVAQGAKGSPAEYTFAVTDNCSIAISLASVTYHYTADINMPA